MVITKVDVMQIKTVVADWKPIICRIYTDEGIYGDGEACLAFGIASSAAFGMLKDLSAQIIGMNPMENEVIWQKLYSEIVWGYNGGPVVFAAISAIDTALWDIKGKALNLPVYALLGGKKRSRIRSYASQIQHGWREPMTMDGFAICKSLEDLKQCTAVAMDEGFDAIKVDFLEYDEKGNRMPYDRNATIAGRDVLKLAEQRMEAVRSVTGENVDIIVEAHSHNSATGAVQLANLLEPYGIFYYEEPNTPNPYTAKYIASHTNVPLASGERIYSRWQYAPYFENGSLRVIQPDIGTAGGLTETKKICDMALTYDVMVQPHVCGTPLSTSVALHLEAVIPNFAIHEYNQNLRSRSQLGITKYNPAPTNGYFEVPEAPGLGNEFIPEAYEKASMIAVITKDGCHVTIK